MKHFLSSRVFAYLSMSVLLLFLSASVADAQTTKSKKVKASPRPSLKRPVSPTPITEQERSVKDLLWFAYGCLTDAVNDSEAAKEQLTQYFNSWENINGYVGLHGGEAYNFTYRGVPIAIAYLDCPDKRQWYCFYFSNKAEADKFCTLLSNDVKGVGIPLVRDRIYGGMSNRSRPVSVFKWVYVAAPEKIKEADNSNIHGAGAVGMWVVEFGVYKR